MVEQDSQQELVEYADPDNAFGGGTNGSDGEAGSLSGQ